MAKPKRKHKRPGGHGSHAAPPSAEAILDELAARADEIAGCDPAEAGHIWGAAHKLLLKAGVDAGAIARLVATRDTSGLQQTVQALRGEGALPAAAGNVTPSDAAAVAVDPEDMKHAMRAFRKRIKLTKLDHESKLGGRAMTSGRKADFDAILPPNEYPREVWDALVAEGKLRSAGQGFFMLAEDSVLE